MCKRLLLAVAFMIPTVIGVSLSAAEPEGTVEPDRRGVTMKTYLRHRAQQAYEQWQSEYDARTSPEQIAEYQKRLRDTFTRRIGGFPERTPLNARVVGVIRREGFRVEKILFESHPKHYVTAALFLPDAEQHKPPYPGVLVPCGHSTNGKASVAYQQACALLALNGIAALIVDPIDQGERLQLIDDDGHAQLDKDGHALQTCLGHTMVGVGCILLGRNTARFEIWDCMRGVDYLQSRPEIDPNRIGCMGNSGGGTQTGYLTALDDRIAAASPSCFVTNYFERMIDGAPHGGRTADAEYQVFGQLVWGMGHADLLMMRAPTPVLICATKEDVCADIDRTWATFRTAKRLYGRMGFAERIDLIEYDGKHHYHPPLREASTRWMMRWLLGIDKPVTEPAMKILSDKEIQSTPGGQTMLLAGARSVYDLNQDYERELAKRRERNWTELDRDELLSQVRNIAGIRKLEELPKPKRQESAVIERPGYTITETTFDTEDGIVLKAKIFAPKKTPSREAVLYLHENGRNADAASAGPIEKLVKEGHIVLAVDLRGVRESVQAFSAYVVGLSYVGMRAEDILVCARWLTEHQAAESPRQVRMIAVGNVGVPALHAAALEPDLFGSVKLIRSLISWSNIIEMKRSYDQLINAVHGALLVYDLDDLAKMLGSKVTIEQPVNAWGDLVTHQSDDHAKAVVTIGRDPGSFTTHWLHTTVNERRGGLRQMY